MPCQAPHLDMICPSQSSYEWAWLFGTMCPTLPNPSNYQKQLYFWYDSEFSYSSSWDVSRFPISCNTCNFDSSNFTSNIWVPHPKSEHSCRQFSDYFHLTLTCFLLYLGQSWIFLGPTLILNFCSTQGYNLQHDRKLNKWT
jgi:hypothetical protein